MFYFFVFCFFFFFKQKTAYEIMPSLVGSEMCIRDRYHSGSRDIAQSQEAAESVGASRRRNSTDARAKVRFASAEGRPSRAARRSRRSDARAIQRTRTTSARARKKEGFSQTALAWSAWLTAAAPGRCLLYTSDA